MREAVGPDVDLMVDINQRWGVQEAIAIGAAVEEFGLGWLEDVTAHNDYQGLAQVAAALDDAGVRRRVSLRHRAVPPDAGSTARSTS